MFAAAATGGVRMSAGAVESVETVVVARVCATAAEKAGAAGSAGATLVTTMIMNAVELRVAAVIPVGAV